MGTGIGQIYLGAVTDPAAPCSVEEKHALDDVIAASLVVSVALRPEDPRRDVANLRLRRAITAAREWVAIELVRQIDARR